MIKFFKPVLSEKDSYRWSVCRMDTCCCEFEEILMTALYRSNPRFDYYAEDVVMGFVC